MRKGLLFSAAALLVGARLALAGGPPVDAESAPAPSQPVAPLATDPATWAAPECYAAAEEQAEPDRLWFSAEYLLWSLKKSPVPIPLATFAPAGSPADANDNAGALGNTDTSVVLGGRDYDTGVHSGARFMAGYWFDRGGTVGIEGGYFYLGGRHRTLRAGAEVMPDPSSLTTQRQQQQQQQGAGGGGPFLTVPFLEANPNSEFAGQENAFPLIMGPGPGADQADFTGGATLTVSSRLQGWELNGVYNAYEGDRLRLDIVGGFRWLSLREDLLFTTSRVTLPPEDLDFNSTRDQFSTKNDFYAGQLGLRAEYRLGAFFLAVADRVALGSMRERVTIDGATTHLNDVGTVTQSGGLFALPTNMGTHTRIRFAVANEVTATAGYDLANWARVTVGYSMLYVSRVARPGNQIDRVINTSQSPSFEGSEAGLVGEARPGFSFHDSSFWAQGVNFGLELRF